MSKKVISAYQRMKPTKDLLKDQLKLHKLIFFLTNLIF